MYNKKGRKRKCKLKNRPVKVSRKFFSQPLINKRGGIMDDKQIEE